MQIFVLLKITWSNVWCQSQQTTAMTLLTYLRNALRPERPPRDTPSRFVDHDDQISTAERQKKRKKRRYTIAIKILSGVLAIMMSVFIREVVYRKYLMMSLEQLEQMKPKVNSGELQNIMFSERFEYIWNFCNKTTLKCSRCIPGWAEHYSRCFFVFQDEKNWLKARRICRNYNGDLAFIKNATDQALLTNLVIKASPNGKFLSAWIGLEDIVSEGVYIWVNGESIKSNVSYWRSGQPDNEKGHDDTATDGQDCVSVVLPDDAKPDLDPELLYNWDDVACLGKRHYICETDVLILP